MKKLNIISVKLPKKQLEEIVKAFQLYYGGQDYVKLRDQERLYKRVKNLVKNLSDKLEMDYNDLYDQVQREAEKRGKIRPVPGKDI